MRTLSLAIARLFLNIGSASRVSQSPLPTWRPHRLSLGDIDYFEVIRKSREVGSRPYYHLHVHLTDGRSRRLIGDLPTPEHAANLRQVLASSLQRQQAQ